MMHDDPDLERYGPDDVELGEEITDVTVQRPTGIVLMVRLSSEEADALERIGQQHGKSLVEMARAALLATIANGALPVAPPT